MDRRILAVALLLAVAMAVGLSTIMTPENGDLPTAPNPLVVTTRTPTVPPSSAPPAQATPLPKATPTAPPPQAALLPPPNGQALLTLQTEELVEGMMLPATLQATLGSWRHHQITEVRLRRIEDALGGPLSDQKQRELQALFTSASDQSAQVVSEFRMERINEKQAAGHIRNDLMDYRKNVIRISGISDVTYDRVFGASK